VFDGHGPEGHLVSERLLTHIPAALFGHPLFPSDIGRAITESIFSVEKAILSGVTAWRWLVLGATVAAWSCVPLTRV
jgi:hypothetical protein